MTARVKRVSKHSLRWVALLALLGLGAVFHYAYAIGVQVSTSAEAVCGTEFSHVLSVEWDVSGATGSVEVTITLTLPDGTTYRSTETGTQGKATYNIPLPGGGTLQVTVEASSAGSTASASSTATVSPCTREGFAGEPKWSGRVTDDAGFHAPPVGSDGKPFDKQVDAQSATNIIGAQYEGDRIDFQVQGVPGQQQQYGINQDCDQDGIGETWTWIFPGQSQALVTGPDLLVMAEVPVQRQAQGFSVPARGSDCAVIVASFHGQVSQQFEQAGGKGGTKGTVQVGELVEQVALNTVAQAIMVEGTQQQQQFTDGQQQQQQQSLKDKFCPPRNRGTAGDVNGDGVEDIFYPENVREYENIKIEVWCISGNTFGKRVTHPDGTQGWVGKCPYVGGQNRQVVLDLNGDGLPDVIRRTIVDGGSDDDGDGRLDAMVYEYDINTRQHTATLTEDGQAVRSQTHHGPYASIGELPFFRN